MLDNVEADAIVRINQFSSKSSNRKREDVFKIQQQKEREGDGVEMDASDEEDEGEEDKEEEEERG